MSNISVKTIDEVDKDQLDGFLKEVFPPGKYSFLKKYGDWRYRQSKNRFILLKNNEIIGYQSVIPSKIVIGQKKEKAIWLTDIIIHPDHRGNGYQRYLDKSVLALPGINIGFPNKVAAKIHKKHGWGVNDDYKVLLYPILPYKLNSIKNYKGLRKIILMIGAFLITPIFYLFNKKLSNYVPKLSEKVQNLDLNIIEKINSINLNNYLITTERVKAHINWRYLSSPLIDKMSFYQSYDGEAVSHYCITDQVIKSGHYVTRILDLYGNFDQTENLVDLLKIVIRDAIRSGSIQVTVLITLPKLKTIFNKCGFLFQTRARFCWYHKKNKIMEDFNNPMYWTLGDSDNDEF